jgi:hypothetical protein
MAQPVVGRGEGFSGSFIEEGVMQRVRGRRWLGVVLAGAVVAGALGRPGHGADAGPDPAAVERARETVRMIDDLYKSAVVHITATYVRAQETTPAARVAQKIFKHMEEKGWHSARLIDATGAPANKANLPKTAFEKKAVEQMKAGKPYVEEIATRDGKPVLRAATIVPVVMEQCITCHPGLKKNDLMGALVYEVPIK